VKKKPFETALTNQSRGADNLLDSLIRATQESSKSSNLAFDDCGIVSLISGEISQDQLKAIQKRIIESPKFRKDLLALINLSIK
jgi:hypothetical protein